MLLRCLGAKTAVSGKLSEFSFFAEIPDTYMYIYIFQEIHKAIFQYSGLELCVSIVFLIVNL